MILAIAEREIKESIKSRRFLLIFGFLLIIGALSLSSSLISWHSWGNCRRRAESPTLGSVWTVQLLLHLVRSNIWNCTWI